MIHYNVLTKLWAKADRSTSFYHPLLFHLVDVAEVAEELLTKTFLSKKLDCFSTDLNMKESDALSWIKFFCGCHDIGKANPCFQDLIPSGKERLIKEGFSFETKGLSGFHHGEFTTFILSKILPHLDWGSESINKSMAIDIGFTVGGHHGSFQRTAKNLLAGCDDRWRRAQEDLLLLLGKCAGLNQKAIPPIHSFSNRFCILLAGLTSVSDWIASSSDFFPYESPETTLMDYQINSSKRAADAIRQLGWIKQGLNAKRKRTFSEMFGFESLHPLQRTVVEVELSLTTPSLILIEAPMGEGKTEAAFYLTEQFQVKGIGAGCFTGLPTQATSNQMFARLHKFLDNRHTGGELHLLHGQALLNPEYQSMRLANGSVGVDMNDPDQSTTAHEWFTQRKRGLLSQFSVGTLDQAMLAVLQTRHFFVRLFGLASKTIVIDEVHAYDTYMTNILKRLIEWMGRLGSSVILLSATLPFERKKELLEAYCEGSTHDMVESTYPRVSVVKKGKVRIHSFAGRKVPDILLEWIKEDWETLGSHLQEELRNGGCAVIIVNTVAKAQDIYMRLSPSLEKRGINVLLLHARFPFGERDKREKQTIDRFGPGHKEAIRDPAVLISTQIVEQSLDLDFDLMVTEIAPVDLVLQRAGRLHRHTRKRPSGLVAPCLRMIEPEISQDGLPDFGSSGHVYDPYILIRSWWLLKERRRVRIPADIEPLIEGVYGPQSPSYDNEKVEEFAADCWEKCTKLKADLHFKAEKCTIGSYRHNLFSNLGARLEDRPDLHEDFQALTRVGLPSVRLICLHDTPSGGALDAKGVCTVDLKKEPDWEEAKSLLSCSVSISHREIYRHFIGSQSVPASWRKNALLRYSYPLIFKDNEKIIDNNTIRFCLKRGIVIERKRH